MRVLGVRGDDREGLKSQRYVLSKVGRVQILVWNFTQGSSFKNYISCTFCEQKSSKQYCISEINKMLLTLHYTKNEIFH